MYRYALALYFIVTLVKILIKSACDKEEVVQLGDGSLDLRLTNRKFK